MNRAFISQEKGWGSKPHISLYSWVSGLTLLAMSLLAPVNPVFTQVLQGQARQIPRNVPLTEAQILDRIRQSGLSREQARAKLQEAGYDQGLADRYFDILESGKDGGDNAASPEFVDALRQIGVAESGVQSNSDSSSSALEPTAAPAQTQNGTGVFGMDFFRRDPSSLGSTDAIGPVDRDYRLGPGDELFLILTGDVEQAYTLSVTREGFVIIPDVGQILVNNLTLEQLEDRLYSRLGAVYSGVQRGAGATTHFQISLGRLRSNQIFVVGDVVSPGAKQISSLGRVLHALYAAGGPTERGSFRRIEIRRGEKLVATFDLYDYLLRGDASNDIRLEHGDRVFVPPVGAQVTLKGVVKRPAIYEVKPGDEGLADVLAFAGGLQADAVMRRVQIDRILPPGERSEGRYRVLRDADLKALENGAFIPVNDGDIVHIHTIPSLVRDRVWISGAVNNPGLFEWVAGNTVSNLIARADGLTDPVYKPRLQIYRLDPATGERSMLHASVDGGVDPILADGDSVVVLSREQLRNPSVVSIEGFVKEGGSYAFAKGMTLRDLVLAAGGFTPGANVSEAEVSRLSNPFVRSDTTAHVFRVSLGMDTTEKGFLGAPDWAPSLSDVVLQPGDRIFIRRAPGYRPLEQVVVTGEVLYPGRYVLQDRNERVVDILTRAGGLTGEAYAAGIRISRRGTIVAADVERALRDPSHRSNISLEPGDSIHISTYDPTVTVMGAVAFSSRVLYRPGQSLDHYLSQAGGITENGDRKRITVSYTNGERAQMRKTLWVHRAPEVLPGSVILVPEKPERERTQFDWDRFLTRTLTVLGTLATVWVAVDR